jgi:hypothetical protein
LVPREPQERVRLQVAFEGGQNVGAVVTPAVAEALAVALAKQEPTFDLETEDGTYLIALAKVVYVRRASGETHIGFGLAS